MDQLINRDSGLRHCRLKFTTDYRGPFKYAMKTPEIQIRTVPQFLIELSAYPNMVWVYRGQADVDWPLVPKAGRADYYLAETPASESCDAPPRDICRFNFWRELAIAYSKSLPENDFECLAFAQHYGLATRLLDWSTNPLVSLFFAVDNCSDATGAVYAYTSYHMIDPNTAVLGQSGRVLQYRPPPCDSRVLLQSGVFTYHPEPSVPLETEGFPVELKVLQPDHGKNLMRFIIEPKDKPGLKRKLNEIGVNRKSLFPDLDGLSDFVNWETMCVAGRYDR